MLNEQNLADGIIISQGNKYSICVDWAYLVMDGLSLAENVRESEKEQMTESIADDMMEMAEIHRQTVLDIDQWLENSIPLAASICGYTPLLRRQLIWPRSVTESNQDAYIEALVAKCEGGQEGAATQFVLNADKATIIHNSRLGLISRYLAPHFQSRTIYSGVVRCI